MSFGKCTHVVTADDFQQISEQLYTHVKRAVVSEKLSVGATVIFFGFNPGTKKIDGLLAEAPPLENPDGQALASKMLREAVDRNFCDVSALLVEAWTIEIVSDEERAAWIAAGRPPPADYPKRGEAVMVVLVSREQTSIHSFKISRDPLDVAPDPGVREMRAYGSEPLGSMRDRHTH